MKLKLHDKIYCHTPCVMNDTLTVTTTVGKCYIIEYMDDEEFVIIDDVNQDHFFHLNKKSMSYYGKWFSPSLKTIRLQKLKKLKI